MDAFHFDEMIQHFIGAKPQFFIQSGVGFFAIFRHIFEEGGLVANLASGAGFAILENMLYEGMCAGYSGWSWGGITLLRSIGSVLHPIGTGIIALGWFRMREGGDVAQFIREGIVKWQEHRQTQVAYGGGDPAQHEEDADKHCDIRPEF